MLMQPTGKRVGRVPDAAKAAAMRDPGDPALPIGVGAIGKAAGRGHRALGGSETQSIEGTYPSALHVVRAGPDVHLFLVASSAIGESRCVRSTRNSW
jgi:hypothetical protein